MKITFHISLIIGFIILSGCDQARTGRNSVQRDNTFETIGPSYSNFDTGTPTTGSITGTGSGSGQNTGNPSTTPTVPNAIPPEVAHCSWSQDGISGFAFTHKHIGDYTYCQSKNDEGVVYIQLKTPSEQEHLCMIPTSHISGTSTYLGEPRCLVVNDPKKIYRVTLLKNRPGYSTYNISGSMIMKDKMYWFDPPFYQYLLAPDAYIRCVNWQAYTGDSSYCDSFNRTGEYVYHQF
jgi:hypothetical protein